MSEKTTQEEKSALIRLCKELGLNPSPNAKIETLEQMLQSYLQENSKPKTKTEVIPEEAVFRDNSKNGLEMVYCKVICNHPDKQGIEGEVHRAFNGKIEIRKTIFYNTPYWIPKIIINSMKEKKYTKAIDRKKNGVTQGVIIKEFPEFTIEMLPVPDEEYFIAMKQRQLAAQSADMYNEEM